MKKRYYLLPILLLVLLVLCACVPLRLTYDEVRQDPSGFVAEANRVNSVLPIGDDLSLPLGMASGYLLAFLRRLYVNWRKSKINGGI